MCVCYMRLAMLVPSSLHACLTNLLPFPCEFTKVLKEKTRFEHAGG